MNPPILRLAERILNREIDFTDAIGEAAGAISVCWDENGVFLSERVNSILEDLQEALAAAITYAVQDADLGAAMERGGWDNWQVTELLLQQRSLGFEEEED